MLRPFSSRLLSHLLNKPVNYVVNLRADFLSAALIFWFILIMIAPIMRESSLSCLGVPIYIFLALVMLGLPVDAANTTLRYLNDPATEAVMMTPLPDDVIFKSITFASLHRFRKYLFAITALMPLMLLSVNLYSTVRFNDTEGLTRCMYSLMGNRYCAPSFTTSRGFLLDNIDVIAAFAAGVGPSIAVLIAPIIGSMVGVGFAFRSKNVFKAGIPGVITTMAIVSTVIVLSSELYVFMLADNTPFAAKLVTAAFYNVLYISIPLLLMNGVARYFPRYVRTMGEE